MLHPKIVQTTRAREIFLKRGMRLWTAIAATSVVFGIASARIVTRCSDNLRGSLILAAGIFVFSLLLCRALSEFLWNQPRTNAVLMGLAVPMTSITPITIAGHLVSGAEYMGSILHGMCGLPIAVGLLYLGGLMWGVAAGRWRRELMSAAGESSRDRNAQ